MITLLLVALFPVAVDCSNRSIASVALDKIPHYFDPPRHRLCTLGDLAVCEEMSHLFLSHIEIDINSELSLTERLCKSASFARPVLALIVMGLNPDTLSGNIYAILAKAGLINRDGSWFMTHLLKLAFGDVFDDAFALVRLHWRAAKDSGFWRLFLKIRREDDIIRNFQFFVNHLEHGERVAGMIKEVCTESGVFVILKNSSNGLDPKLKSFCASPPKYLFEFKQLFPDFETLIDETSTELLRERIKLWVEAFMPPEGSWVITDDCAICLETISIGSVQPLMCKHQFHDRCVQALLMRQTYAKCPLCRATIGRSHP